VLALGSWLPEATRGFEDFNVEPLVSAADIRICYLQDTGQEPYDCFILDHGQTLILL